MKWCRLDSNNFVFEVIDLDPAGRYHPSIVWTECPDLTEQGWFFDGTEVRAPTSADQYPVLDDYKEIGYDAVDSEAESRVAQAERNPSIGINLDDNGRIRNNRRRNNKAKRKVNEITDADDHLLDHIDLIYDSADLLIDGIEAAVDHAAVDALIADINNDANWPNWSPI